jgi:hypothetical protein
MTWCGFVGTLRFLAEIFAYGAFGGLVFWVCAVWGDNAPADVPAVVS